MTLPPKIEYTALQKELSQLKEKDPVLANKILYLSEEIRSEEMNNDSKKDAKKTGNHFIITLILTFIFLFFSVVVQGEWGTLFKIPAVILIFYAIGVTWVFYEKEKLRTELGMRSEKDYTDWDENGKYQGGFRI